MPAPDRRPTPKPIVNEPTVNNTSSPPPSSPRKDVLNAPTVNNARPPDATPGGSGGSGWSGGAAAAQAEFTPLFLLGEGGMGRVLLARHPRFRQRWVALKQLARDFIHDANFRARFDREADVLSRLRHENIIGVVTRGEGGDGPWIAMEYIAGPESFARVDRPDGWADDWPHPPLTLMKRVLRGAKLTPDRVLEMGCQLCRALEHAHKNGVWHRDIKPANILLSAEEVPMLADFGLARDADPTAGELTNPLGEMGTPYYQPPEMVRNPADVDARADLYMLAGTLMFALTGQPPIYCRPDMLDARLRPVLEKAHHPDRNERHASATALRLALEALKTAAEPPKKAPATGLACPNAGCAQPFTAPTDPNVRDYRCDRCGTALLEACPGPECVRNNRFVGVGSAFCRWCGLNLPDWLRTETARWEETKKGIDDLQKALRLPEALDRLRAMCRIRHPRLQEFAAWGAKHLPPCESALTAARADAARRLTEAESHLREFRYPNAQSLLEGCPEPLRTPELTDRLGQVHAALQQLKELRQEIKRDAPQAKTRETLEPLLARAERVLRLQPDDKPTAKLREQIVAQLAKLDDQFYQQCRQAGAIADYDQYLEQYAHGRHVVEAQTALAHLLRPKLLEKPADAALRRRYLLYRNLVQPLQQLDGQRVLWSTVASYALRPGIIGAGVGLLFGGCCLGIASMASTKSGGGLFAGVFVGLFVGTLLGGGGGALRGLTTMADAKRRQRLVALGPLPWYKYRNDPAQLENEFRS